MRHTVLWHLKLIMASQFYFKVLSYCNNSFFFCLFKVGITVVTDQLMKAPNYLPQSPPCPTDGTAFYSHLEAIWLFQFFSVFFHCTWVTAFEVSLAGQFFFCFKYFVIYMAYLTRRLLSYYHFPLSKKYSKK